MEVEMQFAFGLGYILDLMTLIYSNEIEEKVKEELFEYFSNLKIFYKEYEHDMFVNDVYSILLSDEDDCNSILIFENLEEVEEILKERKKRIADTFNSDILNYFNKSLYRSFIEGISRNWKRKKNFKIRIIHSTWSMFYSNDSRCDEVKLKRFIEDLANWLKLNYAFEYIDKIEREDYSVLINVKMIN